MEIPKQTSIPRRAPREVDLTLTVPGGIAYIHHVLTEDPWGVVEVVAPISRFEWLAPDPKDFGLKAIRMGNFNTHFPPIAKADASGAPGPLRPGPIDPIRLRVIRGKRIWIEDYTVTVPVHS